MRKYCNALHPQSDHIDVVFSGGPILKVPLGDKTYTPGEYYEIEEQGASNPISLMESDEESSPL